MKNSYMVLSYTYFSLLFFLPTSTFLTNIALILFAILAVIFGKKVYPIKHLFLSSLWILLAYVGFLGILNLEIEHKEYLKLLPILIIPFAMAYLKKETLVKGLLFLLIAIVIRQIIAIGGIINYYAFTEGKTVALRSYAGINEILHFERPYLGFFSALNIIIAYKLFRAKKMWLFIITSIFSLAIIVLVSARLGLIIAIMMVLAIVIAEMKLKFKYLAVVFVILSSLTFLFFQSNNPLKNRFQQLKYDTRLVVWEGVHEIFDDIKQPVLGLKNQNAVSEKLLDYYENEVVFDYKPDKLRFVSRNYNTHNQFLNEILRGGILGVLILLLPFCVLIYQNIKAGDFFNIILLLSVLLFLMVENLLARQIGVYTVAIILSLSRKSSYEKT